MNAAGGSAPTIKELKAKINSSQHEATFTFEATGASTFKCALIKQPKKHHKTAKPSFSSCKSPKTYKRLKKGNYTFEVRAVDTVATGPANSKSFTIA